ncbi:endonuclease/exonuclease/phosphatase family protein [Streptomyces sp. NPDC099050]|uniref:endonuclease/exonuclease/phosphatase family protein n=1 Tax=Streptomyces sp. NPDC099050 TaxID=3366100 RepID=UPI00380A6471
MRSIKRAAAAAALALAAVFASGGAAPAGAAGTTTTETYTVWHWNVSGHKINGGLATTGMVAAAVGSIKSQDPSPDFVSFNEICYAQYKEIRDQLNSAPNAWTQATNYARFSATHQPDPAAPPGTGICKGQEFGNALFSKAQLRSSQTFILPADYTQAEADSGAYHEDRSMLCAQLEDQQSMKFCTTHITTANRRLPDPVNSAKINTQQLGAVRDILKGFTDNGESYLVAGDFNAEPDMSRMGSLMTTHTELDSTDSRCLNYGEWTAIDNPAINDPDTGLAPCAANEGNPKIDLILARTDKLADPAQGFTADSKSIPATCTIDRETQQLCSDHRVLIGTATITLPVFTTLPGDVTPPAAG